LSTIACEAGSRAGDDGTATLTNDVGAKRRATGAVRAGVVPSDSARPSSPPAASSMRIAKRYVVEGQSWRSV
jgi:hypothetical protein